MPDYQISSQRIKEGFNTKADGELTDKIAYLRERIAPLERSLPPEQRANYAAILKEQRDRLAAATRDAKIEGHKEATKVEVNTVDQMLERQRSSRMPPDPRTMQLNAHLAADGEARLLETRRQQRAEVRALETCYDFLKRENRKTASENTRSTTEKFNTAAKQKGPER